MRIRALVVLVVAGTLAAPAHAQVLLPSQDPFYAVPTGIAELPNGTILKSRPVTAYALAIPLKVNAWQLEYKSLDVHNRPTAMVATVMVPLAPWTGAGKRPLVSFQFAEDASDAKCAPSYALSAGALSLLTESNASTETLLMSQALARGWAVVAPDYEGPDSHFFAAPEEAHGVLDGIRAALAFRTAGFGAGTPTGMLGYSGGGYATSVAALLQPSYAPKLRLAGAAIGSPTEDVNAEIRAFSGSLGGGAIAMAIAALERAYPKEDLGQYLNAAGRQAVAQSAHTCLIEAAEQHPLARIESWEAQPNALELPAVQRFLRSISPLYMSGHPTVPVFEYHDAADEFAPLGPALATMAKWCARGATVDVHVSPGGEHITYEGGGLPLGLNYLAGRFAGQPAADTCPARVTKALRVAPRTIHVDRSGWITLRIQNPNSFRVTLVQLAVRGAGSDRLLARRAMITRIGAHSARKIRVRLSKRAAHRAQILLTDRAADGRTSTTSTHILLNRSR